MCDISDMCDMSDMSDISNIWNIDRPGGVDHTIAFIRLIV